MGPGQVRALSEDDVWANLEDEAADLFDCFGVPLHQERLVRVG